VFKQQINCKGRLISLDSPLIMGILNVTPDSFFDGGQYIDEKSWLTQTEKMLAEGADIIDVGCVSTRPGASLPDEDNELSRLIPVLESLLKKFPDIIISVDTFRSKVTVEAINTGAAIINDVSGGNLDAELYNTIAKLNVPYILMHMQGTPENMQKKPFYNNVTKDIIKFFSEKTEYLHKLGINDIIIDPGFGFGKTLNDNFQLMQNLHLFKFIQHPLIVGISRKSMIWKFLNITPSEALNGTSVLNTLALLKNANILRVHDVKEAKECLRIVNYFESTL